MWLVSFLDSTNERAIWWYDIANIAFMVSLIVGLVATFVIFRTSSSKEEYLKRELSIMYERAAVLEKEAANARLETEKIKKSVAWRVIPPDSVSVFEKVLSAKPGAVNLRYTDGDPEALFLAIQISQILTKAHWKIASGAVKFSNAIVFGIGLPDASGADAQTLLDAFLAAKVQVSPDALPDIIMSFSSSTIEGAPRLVIGSKTPTLP